MPIFVTRPSRDSAFLGSRAAGRLARDSRPVHGSPSDRAGQHVAGKWLLKRSLVRLVPREVIYRAKRGFDLPVGDWLQMDFAELIRTNLSEQVLPGLDYLFLTEAYDDLCGGSGLYEAMI